MSHLKINLMNGRLETSEPEVSIHELARKFTCEKFGELLEDFVNYGGKQYREGFEIGTRLTGIHRTLQRNVIALCLGVVCGLSHQKLTDDRNAKAVESAKKIERMLNDGDLDLGSYI